MVKRLNMIALLLLFVGVFVIILANFNLFVLWRAPSLPVIWTLDLHSNVFTSPTIDSNGTLYVIDENKNLSAVSSDGELKWRFNLDDLTRGEPIVSEDGTIYVYTSNGTLYSITSDGVLKWKLEKVVLPFSSVTLASDGNIYACCNVASDNEQERPTITGFAKVTLDGNVEILNENISFQAIFERQDGKFYAVNQNGTVYLVSKSGEVLWEKNFTNSIFKIGFGLFTLPRGCVKADQEFIYSSSGGEVFSTSEQGILMWKFSGKSNSFFCPVVGNDGTLYLGYVNDGLSTSTIYALDPKGKVKWKYDLQGGISAHVIVCEDDQSKEVIYITSADGYIYKLTSDGKLVAKFKSQNSSGFYTSAVLSSEGILYAVSSDGRIYALKTNSKVSTNSTWYTKSANFENTRSVRNFMEK